MNTTTATASRPWPGQVELRHAHDRHVVGADGLRLDLDAFRDACRTQACELRRQAIAEAGEALRALVRNVMVHGLPKATLAHAANGAKE